MEGGLGLGLPKKKVSQDVFNEITENINNSKESISQKVKMYINAKEYIEACGSILVKGEKICEGNKYVGYGHRAELATILQESRNYANEVTDADKEALKGQYNEWFTLYNEHMHKHDSPEK